MSLHSQAEDPARGEDSGRAHDQAPTRASTSLRLLLRAREGQRTAADLLFRRLLPSMTRWARGRLPRWARARMDTGDLVQEAFLGLLPRMHRIESRRKKAVRTYLRRAIHNRVVDEVRRAGKVEVPASESLDAVALGPAPDAALLEADRQRLFRQGLTQLRPADQQLIVGRLILGYSYEQLALACDRPTPKAARTAVARAIERLASCIQDGSPLDAD